MSQLARFIDVAGRVDDWPPRMLYADGTEISSGSLNELFLTVGLIDGRSEQRAVPLHLRELAAVTG